MVPEQNHSSRRNNHEVAGALGQQGDKSKYLTFAICFAQVMLKPHCQGIILEVGLLQLP